MNPFFKKEYTICIDIFMENMPLIHGWETVRGGTDCCICRGQSRFCLETGVSNVHEMETEALYMCDYC